MAKKNIKALYDSCRLLIGECRKSIEKTGNMDPNIKETLEKSFLEILEFEKYFLIKAQDKFWGTLLMEMDLGVCFSQDGVTDLKIKDTPYTLSVNPLYCEKYSFAELTGAIISEMVRLLYLHPADFAKINTYKDDDVHKMLESASDIAAHTVLKHDIRINFDGDSAYKNSARVPEGSETVSSLNSELKVSSKEDMPLSYYYEVIKKFRQKKDGSGGQGNGQGSGQGIGSAGSQNQQNNNQGDAPSCPGHPSGNGTHQWEGKDEDSFSDEVKSLISECYNSLPDKSRGFTPASILEQIKKILAPPEINWKQILRKMVGSIPVPYRKTKVRLNRRQPMRADLSGRLPKRTVNIVCAFDTSGSMSDEMISYCMNEVFNIVKVYEGSKITIVECDCEIGKVYEAKRLTDIQTKVSGRGGTSFIPVIEYLNGDQKYLNKKQFKNSGKFKDALLVYFTDGYGDSEIPKPKTYRNLWVVFGDTKNLSLKNPYGDVKSIKGDPEFKKRFSI